MAIGPAGSATAAAKASEVAASVGRAGAAVKPLTPKSLARVVWRAVTRDVIAVAGGAGGRRNERRGGQRIRQQAEQVGPQGAAIVKRGLGAGLEGRVAVEGSGRDARAQRAEGGVELLEERILLGAAGIEAGVGIGRVERVVGLHADADERASVPKIVMDLVSPMAAPK